MQPPVVLLIVFLCATLAVLAAVTITTIKSLRASIKSLETKLDQLQSEIVEHQRNLAAIQAVLAKHQGDPFANVLDTVDRYRSRGWVSAVVLVGVRLFRSYLGRRARPRALPVLDKRAEK